jgi:hypothetical protein
MGKVAVAVRAARIHGKRAAWHIGRSLVLSCTGRFPGRRSEEASSRGAAVPVCGSPCDRPRGPHRRACRIARQEHRFVQRYLASAQGGCVHDGDRLFGAAVVAVRERHPTPASRGATTDRKRKEAKASGASEGAEGAPRARVSMGRCWVVCGPAGASISNMRRRAIVWPIVSTAAHGCGYLKRTHPAGRSAPQGALCLSDVIGALAGLCAERGTDGIRSGNRLDVRSRAVGQWLMDPRIEMSSSESGCPWRTGTMWTYSELRAELAKRDLRRLEEARPLSENGQREYGTLRPPRSRLLASRFGSTCQSRVSLAWRSGSNTDADQVQFSPSAGSDTRQSLGRGEGRSAEGDQRLTVILVPPTRCEESMRGN